METALTSVLAITALAVVAPSSSRAQSADHAQTENEALAQARDNIERYRKSDALLTIRNRDGQPLAGVRLEVNQVTQDFLFGNLAFELAEHDPADPHLDAFKERFKALFNYAILPFYWSAYEPAQGKPQWQRIQRAIDWCRSNGITLKGHPLGWTHPAGTPDWLLELPKDTAFKLYEARIRNTVAGFKGAVRIWDVVNEPVNTIPMDRVLGSGTNRDTRIGEGARYDVTGVTTDDIVPWVADSFKWAAEANPDGTFILNEFNLIALPRTRERFCALVKTLLARGVPVRGLGIQAHEPREEWFPPAEVKATLDRLGQFGLPLHITEFIPQSSGKPITGGWREGNWTADAQADCAEQLYTIAFGHPAVATINWWGLSDADIWLPGGGLLDEHYEPKPVYHRLMKLIKHDWMTKHVALATDQSGRAGFRGFQGNYDVIAILPDGTRRTLNVHVRANEENRWDFRF
ncbi:MAG TPA: endo-1,4-beta-xylanase [Opitutus sp.]|nr:endo-1,4-beta-xylanase [Opitutus sp.]